MTPFLPSLREDYFYFVMRVKQKEVTFWDRLGRPFLPFSAGAWALVGLFLIVLALTLWVAGAELNLAQEAQDHWYEYQWYTRLGFIAATIITDFLLGELTTRRPHRKQSLEWPFRVFSLAFSFFMLVTISSYTASLASLLVIENQNNNEFNNIEEAIAKHTRICMPTTLKSTFLKLYPRGLFIGVDDELDMPRTLYSGGCRAMVMSLTILQQVHGGKVKERDCNTNFTNETMVIGFASSAVSGATENHCKFDIEGNDRNDCELIRAGDILYTAPLSFPVQGRLLHSLSWGVAAETSKGSFQVAKRNNSVDYESCDGLTDSGEVKLREEGGLTFEELSGTIVIAILIAAAGCAQKLYQELVRTFERIRKSSARTGTSGIQSEQVQHTTSQDVLIGKQHSLRSEKELRGDDQA